MNSNRRDKWVKNLLVAQAMIMDLPNRKLLPDLRDWSNDEMTEKGPNHCGSTACFGGWVAVHPYFRKQGVVADRYDGSPTNATKRRKFPPEISYDLFGSCDMFVSGTRFSGPGSEKREVLARINEQLEALLS